MYSFVCASYIRVQINNYFLDYTKVSVIQFKKPSYKLFCRYQCFNIINS